MRTRYLRTLGPNLVLLLPGLPLGLAAAVVLWPITLVSAGLTVIWVGLLLFPLALSLATAFAQQDRARLRRWGLEVPPARYRPRGPGPRGILSALTDPRRWLDLAFTALVALPLRAVTSGGALAWLLAAAAALSYPAWAWALPESIRAAPGQWAISLLLGLILAVMAPLGMHALAHLDASVTAPLLGSTPPVIQRSPTRSSAPLATALRQNAWMRMGIALLALVLVVVGWPVTATVHDVPAAVSMLLAIAGPTAALLAVRWPWAGLSLMVLAGAAMMLATAPGHASAVTAAPWPWPVTALLAHCLTLAVLALLYRWFWAASAWSAGAMLTMGGLLAADRMDGEVQRSVLTNAVVLVAISGAVVLLALTVRQWVLVSEQAERAESRSVSEGRRRHELEERSRIAHELHDVVAHSMSVITVQAGTATYRIPDLDAQTRQEFEDIAAASRQALSEMRSLLTILRTEDTLDTLDTVPRPGLPELEELIRTSRATGADIEAELADLEVPPTTGLTVYRIVQESLANALRHARGAAIRVRVRAAPDQHTLLIDVDNDPASQPGPRAPGSGMGLAGARERVAALGGQLEAGPTAAGGFAVSARIPLHPLLP